MFLKWAARQAMSVAQKKQSKALRRAVNKKTRGVSGFITNAAKRIQGKRGIVGGINQVRGRRG